jgi:branched-chain amino acid transport system permease protein
VKPRLGNAVQLGVFVVAGAFYPWIFRGDYLVHLGSLVCLYVVLTSSLNLIVGHTGQFAVAHAAFYGIGAYASVLLVTRAGFAFWPAAAAAVALAAVVALGIGLLTLRLKGAYLAISTFAFSELFRLTLDNWVSLTGGANGIIVRYAIPGPSVPGLPAWQFDSRRAYYYLFLTLAVVTVCAIHRIATSELGRVLGAIRQDEVLALTSGFATRWFKLVAFVVGSLCAAGTGTLYAPYLSFIAPDLFDINETIYVLMIVIIGGLRTSAGPVWGSILLVSLPQLLDIKPFVRMVVYGVILIVIMVWLPGGLVGVGRSVVDRVARLRGARPPTLPHAADAESSTDA